MARPKGKDTSQLVYWLVFAPSKVYTVEANSGPEALEVAARKLGVEFKPWVWRDWNVRFATPEELELRLKTDTTRESTAIDQAVKRQRERAHRHTGGAS